MSKCVQKFIRQLSHMKTKTNNYYIRIAHASTKANQRKLMQYNVNYKCLSCKLLRKIYVKCCKIKNTLA